jgi:DNA/RNA-binding protein KIN17
LDDEARRQKEVERRVKMAAEAASNDDGFASSHQFHESSELQRSDPNEKISLKLSSTSSSSSDQHDGNGPTKRAKIASAFDNVSTNSSSTNSSSSSSSLPPKKMSAMEAMMQLNMKKKEEKSELAALMMMQQQQQQEQQQQQQEEEQAATSNRQSEQRLDYWLAPKLIVKIMNKEVGDGKYYKLKGEVVEVRERFIAVVRVFDETKGKHVKIQLDQDDCETVVPKLNAKAMIVIGRGRGSLGFIEKLDTENFCVSILIDDKTSKYDGEVLRKVEYEDVCKVATTEEDA